MNDPGMREESPFLSGLMRWLIAVSIAVLVAGALFILMARLVDGSWIVGQLIPVFPLSKTEVPAQDPCESGVGISPAFTIEGRVGYLAGDRFVPLADAEIRSEHSAGAGRGVEVDADGRFRLVVALPARDPCAASSPRAPAAPTPQLVIGAPGCTERRVPVTGAWVPHRIVLACDSRG